MANNCYRSTCNSCNNCNSCNDCNSCSKNQRFNSRGCGSLRSLGRSSYNCCNNCNSCPLRCAGADQPCAATCAGYPLYYTGPCGSCPCNNNCNNCGCNCSCSNTCCNNCSNTCNDCCCDNCSNTCTCSDCCCDTCNNSCCNTCPCNCNDCCCASGCSSAAEFIVVAPQHENSGGAFSFANGACRSDGFELCSGGVRITRPGRYIAVYSFSAPACSNTATTLSLSLNGAEMIASRAFVSPALTADSRSAMGQALFEADAGDIIALNTSSALNIQSSMGDPIATVIICPVN